MNEEVGFSRARLGAVETRQNTRTLVIIALIAAGVSLLTHFLNDGKVSSLWFLYLVSLGTGLAIGWVMQQFVLPPEERIPVRNLLIGTVIGGFVGMSLGQNLRFRLIDIPYLLTIRSDAYLLIENFGLSDILSNLINAYSRNYVLFLVIGVFIGVVGFRRILNVIVKWALDYKP